jgi:hypothetical protein
MAYCLLVIGTDFSWYFSVRQGVMLGVLIWVLSFSAAHSFGKPVRFMPYWVRISPNWIQILTDFRLIGSRAEWHSVIESLDTSSEHSVLRDGVWFTVVRRSEDFERTLIFWNQKQAFGGEFEFEENMSPIGFQSQLSEDIDVPARFFMKPYAPNGDLGYSLGIAVPAWWWEEVKASCPAPLAVETTGWTGTVELTLATLPLEEFNIYRDPIDRWSDEYIVKTEPQISKRRDERRKTPGWKDNTPDSEPGLRWGKSIEHKYFNIAHRDLT